MELLIAQGEPELTPARTRPVKSRGPALPGLLAPAALAVLILLVGAGVQASPGEGAVVASGESADTAAVTTRKVTLKATADSYSSAHEPTEPSGTKPYLRADPARTSYVRFSLPALAPDERITAASLELTPTRSATGLVTVTLAAESSWTEATLTDNVRPAAVGAVLASVGNVSTGVAARFTVMPAMRPGTTVSFIIAKGSRPLAEFASREAGASGPRLVLTIAKDTPPPDLTLTGPTNGAWLGAAVNGGSPENFQALEALQQRPLAALRLYRVGAPPLIEGYFLEQLNAGKILVVSWKPVKGSYHWSDITRGDYDDEIRAVCDELAALGTKGRRVFFGFHHEPDTADNLVRGAYGEYALAYRHVHDVCVHQARATNVRWIWIVTGYEKNWPKYGPGDNDPSNGLYPGHDVVDWVAFDNYGYTGCDHVYLDAVKPTYDWFVSNGYGFKPFAHTETGVSEESCKAAWFRSIPAGVRALPKVKMVMYFDLLWRTSSGRIDDYRVGNTAEATRGWIAAGADPTLWPPLP